MPTYVALYQWTDQGVKNVKDTVTRVQQAKAAFERAGAKNVTILWTQGAYDLVGIAEWPNEEAAQVAALALGMSGNVRSETLRAFSAEEMQRILAKIP